MTMMINLKSKGRGDTRDRFMKIRGRREIRKTIKTQVTPSYTIPIKSVNAAEISNALKNCRFSVVLSE